MKFAKFKAVLAAALVAGAGASAWAEDAPEEEVVAFGEAEFWLGGDEVAVASGEGEFWLGPDEIAVASGEKTFWLGPEGLPVGEGAWIVQTDAGCYIVGEGSVTNLPSGFNRESITSAEIQDGITAIGERLFKNCTNLKTVTLGKDVKTFGEKAFYKCFSLETINVANADSLESLTGVVNYHMMWDANGKFVVAPKINIPGYVEMLYGKVNLSDAQWMPIGKLSEQNLEELKDENLYHFFQTRLVKEQ